MNGPNVLQKIQELVTVRHAKTFTPERLRSRGRQQNVKGVATLHLAHDFSGSIEGALPDVTAPHGIRDIDDENTSDRPTGQPGYARELGQHWPREQ